MLPDQINLDRYFQRIGFTGKASPDLNTLRSVQQLHPMAIPFESLNPLTGRPVSLALKDIEKKLVNQQRGGYCFEQNKLLKAALQQIGFQVKGLAARVIYKQSIDARSPFSHQLLLLELDGTTYVADAGFGGMSLTSPLRLEAGMVQSTPHENYRFVLQHQYYRLEASVKNEWTPLYKFHLEEHFDPDYEVMNWYTSCHPNSHFIDTLNAARAFTGGRYALRNNRLSTHYINKPSEDRVFTAPSELITVLREIFQINLSGLPELEARIAQLFPQWV